MDEFLGTEMEESGKVSLTADHAEPLVPVTEVMTEFPSVVSRFRVGDTVRVARRNVPGECIASPSPTLTLI